MDHSLRAADPHSFGPAAAGLFVGGEWRSPTEGAAAIAVENPATGELLRRIASATPADAVSAAAVAAEALRDWRALPATSRAEILERIALALGERETELARTIVEENGKTLEEATGEIEWAQSFFRTYAEEARRLTGRLLAPMPGRQPIVRHAPVGVVLAITPWNDPLGMIARQIAPALAAGCTVVWKPASLTPLTALMFAGVVTDAGLPPGVLNLFATSQSDASISAVLESGLVQKVVFTGSTSIGLDVASRAARVGVPSNLELGGNAAFLVLDDADLERAADGVTLRKFVQAGQGCTCVNRLFVHRRVADRLLELLEPRLAAIKVGNGLDPDVAMGPLIHRREVERLDVLVASAVSAGARILWRGEPVTDESLSGGAFFLPHLLTDVQDDMEVARDEIFGPVLPVLLFDDVEDAIARANDVRHGLAGYVYGEQERALAVGQKLDVGLLGVNDASPQAPYYPVGGIKASGWGVAGGHEGLMEYVSYRAISLGLDRGAADA
jgi:succinate-semialdehyde dehydrogenase/glutarate-semialdehyde dehydrogenase